MEQVTQLKGSYWPAKLALVCTCILWASAFVVIRKAVTVYGPVELALLRYFVASIVMCFLYFLRTRHNTVKVADIPKIVGMGLIGITVYNIALNYGEIYVSSATASFIISQIPVITTVLAYSFLKEKIARESMLGLGISFCGVTIIALASFSNLHAGLSALLIIVSALCGSVFSILQKPMLKRVDPFQLVAWAIWGGTLFMMFWAPATWHQLHTAPLGITAGVVFIGIFPAAIAYALWSYGITHMPVNKAVSYLYTMPLIVLFMAWVFLHELPTLWSLFGGLVALLGVVVMNLNKKP
jgi:drug/metabolite transporter (DMT)-like permease